MSGGISLKKDVNLCDLPGSVVLEEKTTGNSFFQR